MNPSEISILIERKAQESLYLEFKSGRALSKQNDAKRELVKDVTGFANADGGRIVYGIEEKKENDITVAGSLDPITSKDINKDWVAAVIRDNTSPRFHDFDIHEISVDGGRALIVEVHRGGTAHQNLLDQRYYQRTCAATVAITDFQIRDLMARSAKPKAKISLAIRRIQQLSEFHRYLFGVSIQNIGPVTMEKWWFEIDVPAQILSDTRVAHYDKMRQHPLFQRMANKIQTPTGKSMYRISLGDYFFDGTRNIIHPKQILDFIAPPMGIPELIIEINNDTYHQVRDTALPWTLYLNNSPPVCGEIPFSDWCNY